MQFFQGVLHQILLKPVHDLIIYCENKRQVAILKDGIYISKGPVEHMVKELKSG